MKRSKKIQKYFFSYFGIIILLVVIIAANAIIAKKSIRLDLTEDKLYTLSEGTKSILKKLDTPVHLRFYRSKGENRMPVPLRSFAERIRNLLDEYVKHGGGNIILEEYDPVPDSDAEDAANMDNVSGQTMPDGEKLYLGLAISFLDKTVSIPFFSPHEESIIEYNITSAISEAVAGDIKKKIGIITNLPVFGGPQFMRRGQENPQWIIISELKKRFEIVQLNNAESISEDIKALIILHPKNIEDKTLFAIDQYLMKGGRLMIALDPYCFIESRNSMEALMGQPSPPGSSNLEKFLSNLNMQFSQDKVVADISNAMRNLKAPDSDIYPTVLEFRDFATNTTDPAIAGIKHINMVYAGAFSGTPPENITMEKILTASENSALIDSFMAEFSSSQILRDFKKDMKDKILIGRLTGKFKTAFPNGLEEKKADEKEGEQKEEKQELKNFQPIQESPETVVIIVSDVDMFSDDFSVQKQRFLGTILIQPFNENLVLLQNLIEQLSGDTDLLRIRSKRIKERPFTKIVKMQAEAQDKFHQELMLLEKRREEAEEKINELQRGKTAGKQFILSKEQLEEIERYRKEEAQTRKKIKELRKQLRGDIEKLELRIQVINYASVPTILILIGLSIWLYSRKRRSK